MLEELLKTRTQITTRYSKEQHSFYIYYNPKPKYCFNPTLLKEILEIHDLLKAYHSDTFPIQYCVMASLSLDVFNFGGDLTMMANLSEQQDYDTLLKYGQMCVEGLDNIYHNFYNNIISITLLEGSAYGGGFEAALYSSIIIAEEQVKVSFPEIKFNLFPGMGAVNAITNKTNIKIAREIIESGNVYTAQEILDLGIIDHVVKTGTIMGYVDKLIRKRLDSSNGLINIDMAIKLSNDITYDDLYKVVELWASSALNLRDKDLRKMRKFAKAQNRIYENTPLQKRASVDRRFYDLSMTVDRRVSQRRAEVY